MTRFTVDIPDDLNDWLIEQAEESNRSKNKQIVYLLETFREIVVSGGNYTVGTGIYNPTLKHFDCDELKAILGIEDSSCCQSCHDSGRRDTSPEVVSVGKGLFQVCCHVARKLRDID